MRVKIEDLRDLINRKLSAKFEADEVRRIADAILFAEIVGRKTHGLLRLLPKRFGPLDEIKEGPLRVTRPSAFSARIEGRGYAGMLLSSIAKDHAIAIAKENGIALVSYLGNHTTSGCLTYYVREIAEAGYLALMLSNCSPLVAPLGINKRVLGTNPMAVAIPGSDGKDPLIVDFGTSRITFGELAVLFEKGEKLPAGAGVDSEGRETREPLRVMQGGSLLPFGGHKGFGISLAIELICGPLMGAMFSGLHEERGWGNLIVALNPALLGGNLKDCEELYEHFLNLRSPGDADATHSVFRFPGSLTQQKYREGISAVEIDVVDEIYQQLLDSKE